MKLRDTYDSLEDFCADNDVDIEMIRSKLEAAGFEFDEEQNQFR